MRCDGTDFKKKKRKEEEKAAYIQYIILQPIKYKEAVITRSNRNLLLNQLTLMQHTQSITLITSTYVIAHWSTQETRPTTITEYQTY